MRIQRENLLDPTAPNPSVEILLHAFLPHKFIDHTHASAVLSLVDQPDGEAICARGLWRPREHVPYIMPGFALAKAAAEVHDAKPGVEGLILHKHGIFTFGETAREAYERMIALVTLAEERLQRNRKAVFVAARLPQALAPLAVVAPILRGACSLKDEKIEGAWRRMILDFRASRAVLDFVNGAELKRYSQAGVVTPDHTIRTKNWPLILAAPETGKIADFKRARAHGGASLSSRATGPISRATTRAPAATKKMLDPLPRVVLVPGLGLFGLGRSQGGRPRRRRPRRIRDRDHHRRRGDRPLRVDLRSARCSTWNTGRSSRPSSASAKELPLAGQVAVDHRRGRRHRRRDRQALLRRPAPRWRCSTSTRPPRRRKPRRSAARRSRSRATSPTPPPCARPSTGWRKPSAASTSWCRTRARAWQGRIGEVDEAMLRKSFELNFYGHQRVAQAAVKIMLAQGTGGCLLFNVSKQAVNPGPNFGPYGLPKAATLFLVRQYALDYGADGIRANAVNADRIRSGLLTDDFIARALQGARRVREGLHERQPARPRGHRRRRGAGLPAPGAGAQDHRRRHHRRRRQHRRRAALTLLPNSHHVDITRIKKCPKPTRKANAIRPTQPQAAPGFFLKGSHQLDWGMKNRLARTFNPASPAAP